MPSDLLELFTETRARSVALCEPLSIEDHVPQPVEYVSPPKWHLGHTTWFFEAAILATQSTHYELFHPQFAFVFNSYYESQGERVERHRRGDLSRPTVATVLEYRAYVDEAMRNLIKTPLSQETTALIELGIQHEQQHQELLLTDIKYILSVNPIVTTYLECDNAAVKVSDEFAPEPTSKWLPHEGGLVTIGNGASGFAFDNERPGHRVWLEPFEIRSALVTNAEYLAFINDGGYRNPKLWLSDGWEWIQKGNTTPLYWSPLLGSLNKDQWQHFTLRGEVPINLDAPAITRLPRFVNGRVGSCRSKHNGKHPPTVLTGANVGSGHKARTPPIQDLRPRPAWCRNTTVSLW